MKKEEISLIPGNWYEIIIGNETWVFKFEKFKEPDKLYEVEVNIDIKEPKDTVPKIINIIPLQPIKEAVLEEIPLITILKREKTQVRL